MPMAQGTWWFVGILALLCSAASIQGRQTNPVVLFVGSAMAAFLWAVWAINAWAVVEISSGVEFTHSNPALGYLGFAAAFVMVLDLFWAVLSGLRGTSDQGAMQEAPR